MHNVILLQTPLSDASISAILQADLVKILALVLVLFAIGFFVMVTLSLRNAGEADKRARLADTRADKNLEQLIKANEKSSDTHRAIADALEMLTTAISQQSTQSEPLARAISHQTETMTIIQKNSDDHSIVIDGTLALLVEKTDNVDNRTTTIDTRLTVIMTQQNEIVGKVETALTLLRGCVENREKPATPKVITSEVRAAILNGATSDGIAGEDDKGLT